jgi:hypothetical protein
MSNDGKPGPSLPLTKKQEEYVLFDIKFRLHELKERRDKIIRDGNNIISLVQNDENYKLEKTEDKEWESQPIQVPKIIRDKKPDFLNKAIKVVGSVGYTYQEKSFDPTITEAFDTGFYTAIRMIEEGLIELPSVVSPNDAEI